MPQGNVVTAWDGTLLLDPETSEIARMTTRTSELTAEAFVCEIATTSDYGSVSVGGREFPLARETRQRFIDRSGTEVESTVTFSACREYHAASRVSFGAGRGEGPAAAAKPIDAPHLDLPGGLPMTIELTTGIDSTTAAGGDRFSGRLAKPIKDGRNKVLAPEGSAVKGRLVEVAVHMQPAEVAIVLHVETVQVDGAEVPLHVAGRDRPWGRSEWLYDILSNLTIGGGGGGNSGGASGPVVVRHPAEPQGELDALRFPGTRKVLDPGFLTEWVTVNP
jgi:hypothetical protein